MDIKDFEYPETEALLRVVHALKYSVSNIKQTIKLMMIADKYEVLEIREQCREYIMNGTNEDNLIDVPIFAHQLGLDDIQQKALHVITNRKHDTDKSFKSRTIPYNLLIIISRTIYNMMVEKL